MPEINLTPTELDDLDRCVEFCLERVDVFPDTEFQTVFGFTRNELAEWARRWRRDYQTDGELRAILAVVVGQILGYPGALRAAASIVGEHLPTLEGKLRRFYQPYPAKNG